MRRKNRSGPRPSFSELKTEHEQLESDVKHDIMMEMPEPVISEPLPPMPQLNKIIIHIMTVILKIMMTDGRFNPLFEEF